jgi:16S rRNA (cytosine967-C5)-methyltransferase
MDELGVRIRWKVWTSEICTQNQPAKVILRVNTLKTTKETLRAILMDLDIDTDYLRINQML